MKKILIYSLILLGLFNNINSMEKANNKIKKEIRKKEINLGELEALPNEIRYEIVKSIIEDNINSWDDIFNFDNDSLKNDLGRITLVSKDFTIFEKEELKNFIKKLKEKRFEYLKGKIKDKYKDLPEIEFNKKLIYLLNIYLISKENLKECVKLIIAGANIDITNNYGNTALMIAAKYGYTEVVKLLIKMGADIKIKNNYGNTALTLATVYGHIEVVRLLIKMRADIKIKDNSGNTALMLAAYNGHIEVVKLLIEMGADVNVKKNYGSTALILAANNGRIEVVKLLIDMGADVNIATNDGMTALMLAQEHGHTDIVELLKPRDTKLCVLQ